MIIDVWDIAELCARITSARTRADLLELRLDDALDERDALREEIHQARRVQLERAAMTIQLEAARKACDYWYRRAVRAENDLEEGATGADEDDEPSETGR